MLLWFFGSAVCLAGAALFLSGAAIIGGPMFFAGVACISHAELT